MSEPTPESIILTDERIAAVLTEAGRQPSQIVDNILATLRPRIERMIRMRFGIGTGIPPMTSEEIGQKEGLTRERIWQLQNQAFKHLQYPSRRLKVI